MLKTSHAAARRADRHQHANYGCGRIDDDHMVAAVRAYEIVYAALGAGS